jgi:hypothetical protein
MMLIISTPPLFSLFSLIFTLCRLRLLLIFHYFSFHADAYAISLIFADIAAIISLLPFSMLITLLPFRLLPITPGYAMLRHYFAIDFSPLAIFCFAAAIATLSPPFTLITPLMLSILFTLPLLPLCADTLFSPLLMIITPLLIAITLPPFRFSITFFIDY